MHYAPLTHFGVDGENLVALCAKCLKFNVDLDTGDDENVYFGPLLEAVDGARDKLQIMLEPFYEGLHKLRGFKVIVDFTQRVRKRRNGDNFRHMYRTT